MQFAYLVAKLGFACLCLALSASANALSLRTIAVSGAVAPGAGAPFYFARTAQLSDSGSVLFTGYARTQFGGRVDGVWLHDGQQLSPLAISGDSQFGQFTDAVAVGIGPNGKAVFQVQVRYPDPRLSSALPANVIGFPGNFTTLQYDSTLPSDPSTPLGLIRDPAASDQGTFSSTHQDGFLTDRSGQLAVVLPPGTPVAVGAEVLGLQGVSSWQPPVVDDAGHFSFLGAAANSVPAPSTSFGVIRETAGGLQQLAKRGSTAPLIDSPYFLSFGDLQSNGAGHLAFSSSLADATGLRMNALWAVNQDGSLRLVASDSPRHPTAEGVYFYSRAIEPPPQVPFSQPDRPYGRVINEQGRIAFFAQYAYSSFQGEYTGAICEACLWSEGRTGELEEVIAAGDPIAGAPGSVFAGPRSFRSLAMNSAGQHAIIANLTGEHTSALLLTDPVSGVLTAVVKSGDIFTNLDEMGASNSRIVESVSSPSEDFLNDHGEALFVARFTDGTWGVYVASIPEATTAVMTAAIALVLHDRRRRLPRV